MLTYRVLLAYNKRWKNDVDAIVSWELNDTPKSWAVLPSVTLLSSEIFRNSGVALIGEQTSLRFKAFAGDGRTFRVPKRGQRTFAVNKVIFVHGDGRNPIEKSDATKDFGFEYNEVVAAPKIIGVAIAEFANPAAMEAGEKIASFLNVPVKYLDIADILLETSEDGELDTMYQFDASEAGYDTDDGDYLYGSSLWIYYFRSEDAFEMSWTNPNSYFNLDIEKPITAFHLQYAPAI
jgi:hypothetical protein